jgi:hypothetical protein
MLSLQAGARQAQQAAQQLDMGKSLMTALVRAQSSSSGDISSGSQQQQQYQQQLRQQQLASISGSLTLLGADLKCDARGQ